MSLNDPQWGRSSGKGDEAGRNADARPEDENNDRNNDRPEDRDELDRRDERSERRPRQSGASDLDQLWDDFNRALGGILGGSNNGGQNRSDNRFDREQRREADDNGSDAGNGGREPPRQRPGRASRHNANPPSWKTLAVGLGALAVAWCASGIYIVPEGQVGVVTTFGRYTQDSTAGINWHMPWPVQSVEIVDVSSVRKAEIGIRGAQRLSEALMLTDDENIVDVMFNVQYRIKPHMAKEFLFRSRHPEQSVVGAAESAMREVVGGRTMDSVLFESKQEIAANVQQAMQQMLDRYQTGIEVMSVAIQNAQPPQPVQAAFNDAVKAGQDRERQINEGQAYANAVVPAARGLASRLVQEAEGYKARVIETATGDAERFRQVLAQYEKAPQVTRDRLYIDAMRDIYSSTKKVLVDSRSGSNLLYLPFDKLLEQGAKSGASAAAPAAAVQQPAAAAPAAGPQASAAAAADDPRALLRQRGR